jgi:hypothetical protein
MISARLSNPLVIGLLHYNNAEYQLQLASIIRELPYDLRE